tara:strand:- start:28462 stop:29037 length:576 start_codon:yes stop_codon:yes gene_type:complete
MKTIKTIIPFLSLILTLSSCSKNDDDVESIQATPQYPMKTLVESGHMEVKYTKVNWVNTYEMGYEFKSFKNGKITALGIRIPDEGDFRVTLWNADTDEILATIQVVSTSGLLSFEDINPIQIQSGVRYFVSVNTNSYYHFNDSGTILFPVEIGDFLITKYGANFGIAQVLPTQFSSVSYSGMVDVKFTPNN